MDHNFRVLCYFLGLPFSMVVLLKSGSSEKKERSLYEKIKQLNLSSEREAFIISVLEDNDGGNNIPPQEKSKKQRKKKK